MLYRVPNKVCYAVIGETERGERNAQRTSSLQPQNDLLNVIDDDIRYTTALILFRISGGRSQRRSRVRYTRGSGN